MENNKSPEEIPVDQQRQMINDALNKIKIDKEKEMPKSLNNEEGLKETLKVETKE